MLFDWFNRFAAQFRPAPKAPHLETGQWGEAVAARYLRKTLGYRVLARNVQAPQGEIDIVALDRHTLVFVEVRTRHAEGLLTPEQTVDRDKRRHIRHSAQWFIRTRKLHILEHRFDFLALEYRSREDFDVRYHRSAFPPLPARTLTR